MQTVTNPRQGRWSQPSRRWRVTSPTILYGLWHNVYVSPAADPTTSLPAVVGAARPPLGRPGREWSTVRQSCSVPVVSLESRSMRSCPTAGPLAVRLPPLPGGHDEVLLAGLDQAGMSSPRSWTRPWRRGDPHAAVASFVRFWKRLWSARTSCGLRGSRGRGGQPAGVPEAIEGARVIFDRWHVGMTGLLSRMASTRLAPKGLRLSWWPRSRVRSSCAGRIAMWPRSMPSPPRSTCSWTPDDSREPGQARRTTTAHREKITMTSPGTWSRLRASCASATAG